MLRSAEEIVRMFCDVWGTDAAPTSDIDVIVGMFADDRECVDAGWSDDRGHAAIHTGIERQLAFLSDMRCGIRCMIASDRLVMIERLDRFTKRDTRLSHALVAVFELDDAGSITSRVNISIPPISGGNSTWRPKPPSRGER
jgi:limonene-1,2-epoxide hydrolase